MEGSRVLGVVGGAPGLPEVAYLNQYVPVTEEILTMTQPAKATQVLRFAAPCQEKACCRFDGNNCNLVTRVVQIMPAVTKALPACLIRPTCRWHQQEGRQACQRCPQIVTRVDGWRAGILTGGACVSWLKALDCRGDRLPRQ
jgi:hypothetical protein